MEERPSRHREDDQRAGGGDAPTEGVRLFGEVPRPLHRAGSTSSRAAEGSRETSAEAARAARWFSVDGNEPTTVVRSPELRYGQPSGDAHGTVGDPTLVPVASGRDDDDGWSGVGDGPSWRDEPDEGPGGSGRTVEVDATGTGVLEDPSGAGDLFSFDDHDHDDDQGGSDEAAGDRRRTPPEADPPGTFPPGTYPPGTYPPGAHAPGPRLFATDESDGPEPDEQHEDDPDGGPKARSARTDLRERLRRSVTSEGGARSSRAAQPGTDRDLPLALGVGVGLAVLAIVAMTIGPAYGVAFTAIIVTLCAAELFGAIQKAGYQPATLLGLVATASIVLAAYWKGEAALPIVLALAVLFTLLWYLVGIGRTDPTANAGVTILTVTYVGLFGSFAALMLRLPDGTGILLGTVLAVVANDVGALFAGRRFGRHPIAAHISPNKTLEGAVGGAIASVVVSYVALELIGLQPWEGEPGSALALGVLVALVAPIGDLVESMLKRDLDVKDMGSILPGHGGLIDRFDALLLVLPAAYYLCRLLDLA